MIKRETLIPFTSGRDEKGCWANNCMPMMSIVIFLHFPIIIFVMSLLELIRSLHFLPTIHLSHNNNDHNFLFWWRTFSHFLERKRDSIFCILGFVAIVHAKVFLFLPFVNFRHSSSISKWMSLRGMNKFIFSGGNVEQTQFVFGEF